MKPSLLARTAAPAWLVTLVVATWALLDVGHSLTSVLLMAGYWLWVVLLPGILVQRCLSSWGFDRMTELARGAGIGLAAELVVRPVAVGLDLDAAFWLWPLVVVVVVVAFPGLRARARRAPSPADPRAVIGTALASAVGVLVLWSAYLRAQPAPGPSGYYYPDLFFHLGITRTLTRDAWPSEPQAAGEELVYHWFADSHLASLSVATGVDAADVTFHLWLLPMLLVTALALHALAVQVTRVWWTGPALVWLMAAGASTLVLDPRVPVGAMDTIVALSPSQVYVAPLFVVMVGFLVDVARGRREVGAWAGYVLVAGAAAGAKPTALPLAVGGLAFALLWRLVARRRLDLGLLMLLALTVAVFIPAQRVLAGAPGGTGLRLFALLRSWPVYDAVTGDESGLNTGDFFLPAFDSGAGTITVVSLLLVLVTVQAPRLVGLLSIGRSRLRRDGALPLLVGVSLAGWAATLLVDHPSLSQYYFLYTAMPVMTLLTLWLLVDALPRGRTAQVVFAAAAVGIAGACMVLVTDVVTGSPDSSLWLATVAPVVSAVGLAMLVARMLTRSASVGTGRGVVAAGLVALLAFTVPLSSWHHVQEHRQVSRELAEPPRGRPHYVSAAEIEAARWLASASDPDDLVATNVHCLRGSRSRCDARAFWVAALSGRQVLLGGWAYTAASAANVDAGHAYTRPSPWSERLEDSDAAVSDPSADVLERLSREGVRWVFADRTRGPISPRLADLADLRFENEDVQVYELEP